MDGSTRKWTPQLTKYRYLTHDCYHKGLYESEHYHILPLFEA